MDIVKFCDNGGPKKKTILKHFDSNIVLTCMGYSFIISTKD